MREDRRRRIREHIGSVDAGIFVLTETHDAFDHGYTYSHSSAPGRDGWPRDGTEHRWVTICSRFPLRPLPTRDPVRTAACEISDAGLIVFGTVLPWQGSSWRGHLWAGGEAYAAALQEQCADWLELRDNHPDSDVVVLGDFNQQLSFAKGFGTQTNKRVLERALHTAGLVALTAGRADPVAQQLPAWAAVDHICVPQRSSGKWSAPSCWPETMDRSLSDHFGVSVALSAE